MAVAVELGVMWVEPEVVMCSVGGRAARRWVEQVGLMLPGSLESVCVASRYQ